MIDRAHELALTRLADLLALSRSSLYYEPAPVPAGELAIMRQVDALHLAHPFVSSRTAAGHVACQWRGDRLQTGYPTLMGRRRSRRFPAGPIRPSPCQGTRSFHNCFGDC